MKKNYYMVAILAVILVIAACQKEDDISPYNIKNEPLADNAIKLGKKLENPYTVENMQKAYDNLKKDNKLKSSFQIQTTDLYVRFAPINEEEWQNLRADSLELFDMPLDYEIEEGGTFYHDPEVPADQITWQYTVVPVNYNFTNIKYEVLAELFLQDEEDDDEMTKSGLMENKTWAALEDEALKITGNYDPDDYENEGSLKRKWRPSGQIKVEDDLMGIIPLEGVRVVVKRWFKWKHAITDKYGRFSTGRFRSKRVKYGIKWERSDFDIRSGNFGQAWYNFVKKKRKAWNLTIIKSRTPKSWLYAHIHRAAHQYFYRNTIGISSPPRRKFLRSRIKIGGHDKKGKVNGDYSYIRNWATWPHIRIYSKTRYGKRTSRDIYATVIHELSHAAHYRLVGMSTYNKSKTIVKESWARGVQWALTRLIYKNYEPKYGGNYTGLVQDLIDTENNRYDKVSGYSMIQVEQALKGAKTFNDWKNNLKSKYENNTEKHLDELFAYWD